ncbi:MAG TPA: hypothetical protein EYN91_27425 [Candidatus Melainabacteria bacterium]|nr:hypothetical protein [Candidatus Melainabacteria bacterium]HIN67193.1 hypothetical protein [Candidatus Obscuribacterales bacterium]
MKKPLTSAALIAITTAFYSTPALCIEEIEEWQRYIKQEEAGGKKFANNVAEATICLAEQYQRYGMIKQADETFERAVQLCKKFPPTPPRQYFPYIYISWARTILKGRLPSRSKDGSELRYQATETARDDFSRIYAYLKRGWNEMVSIQDPTKISAVHYNEVVKMFHETGNAVEEQKCEKYILRICDKIESSPSPTKEQIKWATEALNGLAYSIYPEVIAASDRKQIESVIAEMNASTNEAAPENRPQPRLSKVFSKLPQNERAESMRLRSLALIDRNKNDERARIEAHRYMALWYMSAGMRKGAIEQTKILSDLMGVKEAFLLFPLPQACHGRCGMG